MKRLKWCVSAAKLKINNEHKDTNLEKHAMEVFCLVLKNFVSIGQTKAMKG